MLKIYPAIFEKDLTGYGIFFPDVEGAVTQADTLNEGLEMASDALGRYPWLKHIPELSESFRIFATNIISWFAAVTFAFVTNKHYVFESKAGRAGEVFKELLAFFGSRVFSLAAESLIIILWVSLLGGSEIVGKVVIGQIVVLVLNFVLSKFFVFKKTEKN